MKSVKCYQVTKYFKSTNHLLNFIFLTVLTGKWSGKYMNGPLKFTC